MSADNWEICPRCLQRAQRKADKARENVMADYGKVPVDEFDARRAALKDAEPEDYRTFREDYEVWGADQGTVHMTYSGQCTVCGLSAALEAEQPLDVS